MLTWRDDTRREAARTTCAASGQAERQVAATEGRRARRGSAEVAKLTLLVVDGSGCGEDGRAEKGCLVHGRPHDERRVAEDAGVVAVKRKTVRSTVPERMCETCSEKQ